MIELTNARDRATAQEKADTLSLAAAVLRDYWEGDHEGKAQELDKLAAELRATAHTLAQADAARALQPGDRVWLTDDVEQEPRPEQRRAGTVTAATTGSWFTGTEESTVAIDTDEVCVAWDGSSIANQVENIDDLTKIGG